MMPKMKTYFSKGVTYDTMTNEVISCLFCKIQNREEPGTIEYEDEEFVVFRTIQPATHTHLLVTPRKHITSTRSLRNHNEEDIGLVERLIACKEKIPVLNKDHNHLLCFHIPPFTSIDHLHLHIIAEPEKMPLYLTFKYPMRSTPYCKSANEVLKSLKDGTWYS